MEEKVVGVLATLLKQDAEVVTESLKTDEGVETLVSSLTALKTFNDDEFSSLKDNIKKDQKDSIYNEVKGITLEMVEKQLKKQHSLEWKRGEDYEDVNTLVAKLVNDSVKAPNGDEQLKKDLETLQERYNVLEGGNEEKLTNLSKKHREELSNIYLATELTKLKPELDYEDSIIDGQLEMFQTVFNQNYSVSFNEEGVLIVKDKAGEILKNDDVSPKSLTDVVTEVSKSYLKHKEVVSKNGRGNKEPNKNTLGNKALNKYATFEDYLSSKEGEGLQMGSIEMQTKFKEWTQAQNN